MAVNPQTRTAVISSCHRLSTFIHTNGRHAAKDTSLTCSSEFFSNLFHFTLLYRESKAPYPLFRAGLGECLINDPRNPPEKFKYPNMLAGAMYDGDFQCDMSISGSKICPSNAGVFRYFLLLSVFFLQNVDYLTLRIFTNLILWL